MSGGGTPGGPGPAGPGGPGGRAGHATYSEGHGAGSTARGEL